MREELSILLDVLCGRRAPDISEDQFFELNRLVHVNRLEPLMAEYAPSEWMERFPQTKAWLLAYQRNLVYTTNLLQQGERLMAALEEAGIRSIGYRGPFAGKDLYGDVALRYAHDVDILVHRRDRDAALRVAVENGFAMQEEKLPLWFFRRHHLHWPLYHTRSRVYCDLHWAVDHPYALVWPDLQAILSNAEDHVPAPEHAFLLTCAHLYKHDREILSRDDAVEQLAERGRLLSWLDLWMFEGTYGDRVDRKSIEKTAHKWSMTGELTSVMRVADMMIEGRAKPLAEPLNHHGAAAQPEASPYLDVSSLTRHGGFRTIAWAQWLRYLWPPKGYLSSRYAGAPGWRRVKHLCRAGWDSLVGAVDLLACYAWMGWRRARG